MNQTPVKEKVDGILEIILKEDLPKKIYASRINGNGSWSYIRSNGQVLRKETKLNPKQMAIAIGKEYSKLGIDGKIRWSYIK